MAPEPRGLLRTSRRTALGAIGAFLLGRQIVRLAAADLPRARLFEEDPSSNGQQFDGIVQWTVDRKPVDHARSPGVRASIAIHERQMVLSWTLRRNDDKGLPASHIVELLFTLPADFPHGGIESVPGLLMKTDSTARGTPLAATVVKVSDVYFMVGLSNVAAERDANMRLLAERDWLDVAIVYADGRRAVLAFEKGADGRQALREAFAAWEGADRP